MKLQNLTVIFIIIIIPIILLLSLYISTGLRSIKYQALYDTGLLTATHDAIYAFELNTANDVYSDNAETKRNILKSSIKMFEKSLCNVCGISSYNTDEIEKYIPAIVFGMYDGFYMYAPSGVYNNETEKTEYEHNLKNYVYYSETLDDGTVIIYSLDNYVVVSGQFGSKYEVREGYLIVEDDWEIYESDAIAKAYLEESKVFTQWFNSNVANKADYLEISSRNNPEDNNSAFVQNKRKIIKEKIENVLNSTITSYSNRLGNYNFKMPKLSLEDWEKIYSNISMLTFFQGKNIGLTKYNGYCVLNSTNSNEYVNPNLMYFIENGEYHNIRCTKLEENISEGEYAKGYKIGDFQKKKVINEKKDENGNPVYDENNNIEYEYTYEYNHNELVCYDCINGQLNEEELKSVTDYIQSVNNLAIKKSYLTSLARERYSITKLIKATGISAATEVNVEVNWEDEQNSKGHRPEYITFKLYKKVGNTSTYLKDITISKDQSWKTIIKDLDIYENGTEIIYTIEGYDNVNKYEGDLAVEGENTWKITYTQIQEISKTVNIVFDDNDNQDGIRPNQVQVQLYKDYTASGENIRLNASNNWKYTWNDLPERENRTDIIYTVEARSVTGYTISSVENNNVITITYKHIPEVVSKTIFVYWDDVNNVLGKRPNSVIVELYRNSTKIEDYTLSKNQSNSLIDFRYNITNLPKYENGEEIVYTIKEKVPTGYKAKYEEFQDEFYITNVYEVTKKISLKFDDYNNKYGVRPESIDVYFYNYYTQETNKIQLTSGTTEIKLPVGTDVYDLSYPTSYTHDIAESGDNINITLTLVGEISYTQTGTEINGYIGQSKYLTLQVGDNVKYNNLDWKILRVVSGTVQLILSEPSRKLSNYSGPDYAEVTNLIDFECQDFYDNFARSVNRSDINYINSLGLMDKFKTKKVYCIPEITDPTYTYTPWRI